ncbi:MAG: restriction endonuclease [Pseudomonadota bacterium]
MARRSQSTIEDVMDLTAKLPWWVGVTLALISYIALHLYAIRELPNPGGANDLGKYAAAGLFHTLALFGQYILPFAFLVGALISAFNTFKRKKLYDGALSSKRDNPLNNYSWQEFELLIGEHFRRQGYSVEETKGGADGGADLILRRSGEKHLVQCKQWKAYKVGVKIVRELLGVMVGVGATGGFVITSGEFTKDALAFANANNIVLLDGKALHRIMQAQSKHSVIPAKATVTPFSQPDNLSIPIHEQHPTCPKCDNAMVLRVAKQGSKAGEKFWGCSKFPACRAVIPFK